MHQAQCVTTVYDELILISGIGSFCRSTEAKRLYGLNLPRIGHSVMVAFLVCIGYIGLYRETFLARDSKTVLAMHNLTVGPIQKICPELLYQTEGRFQSRPI